jgi:hypothetical protein
MSTTLLPQPTARCAASSHREAWFSEDPEDRFFAAAHCAVCPLVASCAARAPFESAGLWGGVTAGDGFELLEPPAPEHRPSRGRYAAGCRCGGCTARNRAYVAARRAESACHKGRESRSEQPAQLALMEV